MALVRSRRTRRLLVALGVLITLVLGWVGICVATVVYPSTDRPAKVDAVLVLGPPTLDDRLAVARRFLAEGLTSTVVISVNSFRQVAAIDFCQHPPAGAQVLCFTPDPSTTRGEAEHLRELAIAHHWTRVAVATSTYHVSRARLIVGRCFAGTVLMVAAPSHPAVGFWLYQFVYQSAAWVKAQFLRSC